MEIPFMQKKPQELNKVVSLPTAAIESNRSQPRTYIDEHALAELCQSIESSGLLQPVTVRKLSRGGYELIAGERRLMAFRVLGRSHIPAIVEDFTDEQSAVLALIENLQRSNLNCFEEAVGIARLIQELNLTQHQVSQKLGKAQSTVANKLRLLKFSATARDLILAGNLTERHARAFLKLPNPNDTAVIEHIIKNRLNVEETELYILRLLEEEKPKSTRLVVIKDMRIFLNSINKAVKIMESAGIEVESQKRETDEYVEMVIRVPKAAVYRKRPTAAVL